MLFVAFIPTTIPVNEFLHLDLQTVLIASLGTEHMRVNVQLVDA